jgi:hypothetical protein
MLTINDSSLAALHPKEINGISSPLNFERLYGAFESTTPRNPSKTADN